MLHNTSSVPHDEIPARHAVVLPAADSAAMLATHDELPARHADVLPAPDSAYSVRRYARDRR